MSPAVSPCPAAVTPLLIGPQGQTVSVHSLSTLPLSTLTTLSPLARRRTMRNGRKMRMLLLGAPGSSSSSSRTEIESHREFITDQRTSYSDELRTRCRLARCSGRSAAQRQLHSLRLNSVITPAPYLLRPQQWHDTTRYKTFMVRVKADVEVSSI